MMMHRCVCAAVLVLAAAAPAAGFAAAPGSGAAFSLANTRGFVNGGRASPAPFRAQLRQSSPVPHFRPALAPPAFLCSVCELPHR